MVAVLSTNKKKFDLLAERYIEENLQISSAATEPDMLSKTDEETIDKQKRTSSNIIFTTDDLALFVVSFEASDQRELMKKRGKQYLSKSTARWTFKLEKLFSGKYVFLA